MLPAFLLSCSKPGLQGPEPPTPVEGVNEDGQSTGLDTSPVMWTWVHSHG